MGKWYLNPDGKFPLDEEGKPMFLTEAEFKGCCCNMCQWRRKFEWDCEEEEWVEEDYGEEVETDGEWIPAERDPGESEELCTRTVWGEIVNCLVDPRPEPPPEPDPLTEEEIEECCPPAPCECPEEVLDQYSITNFFRSTTFYEVGSTGCSGPIVRIDEFRQVGTAIANRVVSFGVKQCRWQGTMQMERRTFIAGQGYDAWSPTNNEQTGVLLTPLQEGGCAWQADRGGQRLFGLDPRGTYSVEICGEASPPSNPTKAKTTLTLS